MISAVSGVSFKGEGAVSSADLINAPGKFSSAPASLDAPADSFESKGKEKKGHAGTVMGSIVGLLALAYVALGLAVGKGKLKKVEVLPLENDNLIALIITDKGHIEHKQITVEGVAQEEIEKRNYFSQNKYISRFK